MSFFYIYKSPNTDPYGRVSVEKKWLPLSEETKKAEE